MKTNLQILGLLSLFLLSMNVKSATCKIQVKAYLDQHECSENTDEMIKVDAESWQDCYSKAHIEVSRYDYSYAVVGQIGNVDGGFKGAVFYLSSLISRPDRFSCKAYKGYREGHFYAQWSYKNKNGKVSKSSADIPEEGDVAIRKNGEPTIPKEKN